MARSCCNHAATPSNQKTRRGNCCHDNSVSKNIDREHNIELCSGAWTISIVLHYKLVMSFCISSFSNRTSEYLEQGTVNMTALLAGILQTLMYGDFFYYYIQSIRKGKPMVMLSI